MKIVLSDNELEKSVALFCEAMTESAETLLTLGFITQTFISYVSSKDTLTMRMTGTMQLTIPYIAGLLMVLADQIKLSPAEQKSKDFADEITLLAKQWCPNKTQNSFTKETIQ